MQLMSLWVREYSSGVPLPIPDKSHQPFDCSVLLQLSGTKSVA